MAPRQPIPVGAEEVYRQNDARLRPYVMARAIDGRVVDGEDLARLRQANLTVDAIRQSLPMGRGNAVADIEHTAGESSRSTEAGINMANHLERDAHWNVTLARATGALLARAANCDGRAALSVMAHTPHVQPGEALYQVTSSKIGHVWAEWRREGNPRLDFALVMDAWMEGPAVFASDGQLSEQPGLTDSYFNFSHVSGLAARAQMDALLSNAGSELQARFMQERLAIPPDFRTDPRLTYAAMSVISRGFELRVQKKLARTIAAPKAARVGVPPEVLAAPRSQQMARRAVLNDVLAVGVARTMTPGLGIKAAQGEAPELLHAAGHRLRDKDR